MSVTVVSRPPAAESPSTDSGPVMVGTPDALLAATRATTFLRAQAQWLGRGLRHAGDRVAVDIVIGAHDRSHDRWVGIIRLVDAALGNAAANEIATVYAYVGRVAGSLERGATDLLDAAVAEQVRTYLEQRLDEVTESAVEVLWAEAASA